MGYRSTLLIALVVLVIATASAQTPQYTLRPGETVSGISDSDWSTIRLVLPPSAAEGKWKLVVTATFQNLDTAQYGRLQVARGNTVGSWLGEVVSTPNQVTSTIDACDFPGGGNYTVQVTAAFSFVVTVNIGGKPWEVTATLVEDSCNTLLIIILVVVGILVISTALVCLCLKTGCCGSPNDGRQAAPAAAAATPQVVVMAPAQPQPAYPMAAPVAYPGHYGKAAAGAPGMAPGMAPGVGMPPASAPMMAPVMAPAMAPVQPRRFACPFCQTQNGAPGGYRPGMQISCCSCRQVFALP